MMLNITPPLDFPMHAHAHVARGDLPSSSRPNYFGMYNYGMPAGCAAVTDPFEAARGEF